MATESPADQIIRPGSGHLAFQLEIINTSVSSTGGALWTECYQFVQDQPNPLCDSASISTRALSTCIIPRRFTATQPPLLQDIFFSSTTFAKMADQVQELLEVPSEFAREGIQFVRRCTKRTSRQVMAGHEEQSVLTSHSSRPEGVPATLPSRRCWLPDHGRCRIRRQAEYVMRQLTTSMPFANDI